MVSTMFEKHGQNIISGLVLAAILWVGSSVNSLEKQAIRQESQTAMSAMRYEQLSTAIETLTRRIDAVQAEQKTLALENAVRSKH